MLPRINMSFDKNKPDELQNVEIRWTPEYENEYAVSEDGRVFSFKEGKEFYELSQYCLNDYPAVKASYSHKYIHRLVLYAFEGPPPTEHHECRHLDGDKKNNHIDDLTWGTHSENEYDKKRHGTDNYKGASGEDNNTSKLSNEEVVDIRERYCHEDVTLQEISDDYPVSYVQIHHIVTGENRSEQGGPIKGEDY